MYRIINIDTGVNLGVDDKVIYIKFGESGDFTPTTENEAIGVALNGVPYNLIGHSEIKGADTVVVSEIDVGAMISEQILVQENTDAMNIDLDYRITLLELGLSETCV